ncbi:MAG: hypothetical protein ACFCUE_07195 [Candidatus Bathyarchaeia archaeon]|jgi:hypothetical protein
MKFFTVTDQSSTEHKILVINITESEYNDLVGQCEKCMPTLFFSSLIRAGHPYVVVDFGPGGWKTAIALDEESEDGHRIGDELGMGEVLTVILTSKPNAVKISKDKAYMNVPIEQVIIFSFLYTADIAQNYAVYNMYKQPKSE